MKRQRRRTVVPAGLTTSTGYSLADPKVIDTLRTMSDDALSQFAIPMFQNPSSSQRVRRDADGFPDVTDELMQDLHSLQKQCWDKATSNPQISSHVRDQMGRMAGNGFKFNSELPDVAEFIEEIVEDPRNDLYQNFPKYAGRSEIEGELFLILTVHNDGFIEIDFTPPNTITGGGDKGSGIIFHSRKKTFPLFYCTTLKNSRDDATTMMIPSINIAYYPDLVKDAMTHSNFSKDKIKACQTPNAKFKKFGGFYRFMIHWNKGLMVPRNVSHIRTTLKWANYYEMLKEYEIDHKRSSGAYLWVIKMEDTIAFRRWLQMTDAEREATGVMQVKEPGGTVVLPPGMVIECINPKLPTISDQDNDIMQMISSGLQKPQDQMLGDYKSTYASVKAAQGPQGDRIMDELHYFKLFLTYSFWRPILFLVTHLRPKLKWERTVEYVIDFKNKKPIKKKVQREVWKFVDISMPMSRLDDLKEIGAVLLGSKHGSIADTLGIPKRAIASKLGFGNYSMLRKEKAIEDERYPETLSLENEDAAQEKSIAGNEKTPTKPTKAPMKPAPKKPVKKATEKK